MSKRDDRQWATNIAFHRSPLYLKSEKAEADTAKLTRKLKAKTDAKMAKVQFFPGRQQRIIFL